MVEPCNRLIYAGFGFRYPCTHIRGCCPIHNLPVATSGPIIVAADESEALLPPTGTTTPAPPALSLFEAV